MNKAEWKKVRLGDICEVNMGQSPDSDTYNTNMQGLPFYQGNADFGEIHPSPRFWCTAPKKLAKENDILISVRAPIGALNISAENCCIGRGLAAVTAKTDMILRDYVFYTLKNKKSELNNKGTGSTFKAIGKDILNETKVLLPPLADQQHIVAVLDKISSIISARKRQLEQLDLLVKSRFVEMFGDLVVNEKKWPITTIGEIAEIKIGPFGTLLHKEDYVPNCHALVNPSHIIDGKIATDSKLTVTDKKYEELSAYKLLPNDIVLGRRGEMGRCAVVTEKGLLCGTGSLIIRTNSKMKPFFLQNILSNPLYKKIIEDKAVGVTMQNLNVPIVSSLEVPLLPLPLQEEFAAFVAQTDKSKSAVQKSLDQTQILFDSLMQEYFG